MKYYIMFGVTLIICIIIIFLIPILGYYENSITIDYTSISSCNDCKWIYSINNDHLTLNKYSNSYFSFLPNKNGFTKLYFTYINNNNVVYNISYKFFIFNNKIYWIQGEGIGLLDYPNPF